MTSRKQSRVVVDHAPAHDGQQKRLPVQEAPADGANHAQHAHTANADKLRLRAEEWTIERAAEVAGIDPILLNRVAEMYADHRRSAWLCRVFGCRHRCAIARSGTSIRISSALTMVPAGRLWLGHRRRLSGPLRQGTRPTVTGAPTSPPQGAPTAPAPAEPQGGLARSSRPAVRSRTPI